MCKKFLVLFLLALSASAVRAQTVAYVANNIDGTVEVLNASTNTKTVTIGGFNHPADLAVSPDGRLLYVFDTGNSQISVVNTATNTVTATIAANLGVSNEGMGPKIAFNPNGKVAYFAATQPSTLVVINTATSSVAQTVSLPSGFYPVAVAAH